MTIIQTKANHRVNGHLFPAERLFVVIGGLGKGSSIKSLMHGVRK